MLAPHWVLTGCPENKILFRYSQHAIYGVRGAITYMYVCNDIYYYSGFKMIFLPCDKVCHWMWDIIWTISAFISQNHLIFSSVAWKWVTCTMFHCNNTCYYIDNRIISWTAWCDPIVVLSQARRTWKCTKSLIPTLV